MDFSDKHPAVIAIAAGLNSYTKAVDINTDGTLNWFGVVDHPSDADINSSMVAAQADYDANGPLGHPDRG